jgi:hypothetical protein
MGWREDLGNFDLGRLTFVGWLVFLLSIVAGIVAAIIVGSAWDMMIPPQLEGKPQRTGPAGFAGFGGALAFFFTTKFVLNLVGISLMSPKQQTELSSDEEEDRPRKKRPTCVEEEDEADPSPKKRRTGKEDKESRFPKKIIESATKMRSGMDEMLSRKKAGIRCTTATVRERNTHRSLTVAARILSATHK